MLKVDDILKRLRELRKKKSLNQDYIAKRLGIDRTTYVRKERGIIPITTREWLLIADVMSEDPACFFVPSVSRKGKRGVEKEGVSFSRLYSLMSRKEKRDLMGMLILASRILKNDGVRKMLRDMETAVL